MQIDLNPSELELLIKITEEHSIQQMECGMKLKNINEDDKFNHYSWAGEARALATRLKYCLPTKYFPHQ